MLNKLLNMLRGNMTPTYTCATLVGTAIGDALGMPFEMKKHTDPALMSWDGSFKDGSWHKLKSGQWTDDTQMSVALAQSLVKCQGFTPPDVARAYLAWYKSGDCRGMGGTTRKAMIALEEGKSYTESGVSGVDVAGNGTAMRAAPLGIYYRDNLPALLDFAKEDAAITHNAFEPIQGEIAVAVAAALLADRKVTHDQLIEAVLDHLHPSGIKTGLTTAHRLIKQNVFTDAALRIVAGPKGYIIETVATAFYCFARFASFEQAVVAAVKAGGDTDTVAAITGALAGTYYGLENIPNKYISGLEGYNDLAELDRKLFDRK